MSPKKIMFCEDCILMGVPVPENNDTCGNCGSHSVTVYEPVSGLQEMVDFLRAHSIGAGVQQSVQPTIATAALEDSPFETGMRRNAVVLSNRNSR